MDLVLIAQGLLNGLLFGGVYSLMAVGLTLIFGVMRVVNFAHGDMMVWGMYLAFLLATRLVTFLLAGALTGLLYLFLFRTDLGRSMRAAADNPYGAAVIGTDVRRVYAVAFGIGAACVGAAGALVAPFYPFQPSVGLGASVTSFNIVIIGGMGSLPGAFLGGLLVAVAESLGAVFLSPSLK